MLDRFTPAYAIEDFAHLGAPVRRDDDIDATADRFRGGKSKQTLRSPVPAVDGPIEFFCDDGIVG